MLRSLIEKVLLVIAVLCLPLSLATGSVATDYLDDEVVDAGFPIRFSPEDWSATVVSTMTMTTKGEGEDSNADATTTFEFAQNASFVGDVVTFAQLATRHTFELVANGERENMDIRGPELSSYKIAARIQGKLLSSEFVVSERYVDELAPHFPKTASILKELSASGASKDESRKFIKENFSYLVNDISLGQVLGSEDGLGNAKDLKEVMKMCGGEPEPIVIRVIGASSRAVIGKFHWSHSNEEGCKLNVKAFKLVDRYSGRPILTKIEIKLEADSVSLDAGVISEYTYSSAKISAGTADGPSLERCKATPRKSSPVTYPEDSKARGEQGTVILKIVPSSSGRVQSVNLEKSSGIPLLDEWATADVRSWIFDPDACAGVTMSIPIKYEQ